MAAPKPNLGRAGHLPNHQNNLNIATPAFGILGLLFTNLRTLSNRTIITPAHPAPSASAMATPSRTLLSRLTACARKAGEKIVKVAADRRGKKLRETRAEDSRQQARNDVQQLLETNNRPTPVGLNAI